MDFSDRGYWSSYSKNIFIKCYAIVLNYCFDRMRYYFSKHEYDCNADYLCCYCSHPVLRRFLYCTIECSDKDDLYADMKFNERKNK